MGLPNEGSQKVATNLSKRELTKGPIVVSISGLSIEEFVECYRQIEPLAEGIELNISTPNTADVRIFQEPDGLRKLLAALRSLRAEGKPVWVKIPPYFNGKERENVHNLIDECVKASVDAITATNTKRISEPRASIGTGGLSGPLIYQDTLRIVADVYNHTGGKIPINACGGISSGLDVWRAFEAGASSVQLYTALIYKGPGIVSKINRELLRMLESSKLNSLSEVTGSGLH
jgi:dihydroorotate dehydrogenase